MQLIKIGITDVILQDFEDGKGKIIVSNFDYDYNFSYYWGSMGINTDLKKFLSQINSDYFAMKLTGHINDDIDVKATFTNLRREIKEFMPWYKHVEFQKDMRECINIYQQRVDSQDSFVNLWDGFVSSLSPWIYIDDRQECKEIESFFEGYAEHWNLIVTKPPKEYDWCLKLHKQLIKHFN